MTEAHAAEIVAHVFDLWPQTEWTPATQDAFCRRLLALSVPPERAKAILTRIRMGSKWPRIEPGELWPSLLAESQHAVHATQHATQHATRNATAKTGADAIAAIAASGLTPTPASPRCIAACRAEIERANAAGEPARPSRVIAALAAHIGRPTP